MVYMSGTALMLFPSLYFYFLFLAKFCYVF